MRSTRLSHFLDFYGNAHDSRFAGSSPNVRLSRFVASARAATTTTTRASIARTRRTMRAREKICETRSRRRRSDSFGRARARARDFFSARTETKHLPRGGGEKRRLSSFSTEEIVRTGEDLMRARRPTARAFTRTRKTRTHPSTRLFLPRRTSVTS